MGVMSCDRNGCDNVMCDRHSDKHGYICYECFDELVKKGAMQNISEFMKSNKDDSLYSDFAIDIFENEFPIINYDL
jgi:hypothetical protein